MRHRCLKLVPAALIAVLAAAGLVTPAAMAAGGQQTARHVQWRDCGAALPGLLCADLRVPLNYREPHGRQISIAVSKLPAADQSNRRGVLLLNPGGPGGSGLSMPAYMVSLFPHRPELFAKYDLIGFDPRFVGASTPITCGLPAGEAVIRWADVTDLDGEVERARYVASMCRREAGWALPHAGTANVARDMDRIRAALGEPKLSYLGYSYGATIGRAYLGQFPHRADRFIMDSNTNPATTKQQDFRIFAQNFERMLGLFSAFAAADPGRYHLGDDAAEVRATFDTLVQRALADPVESGEEIFTGDHIRQITWTLLYAENRFDWLGRFIDTMNQGIPLAPDIAWIANLRGGAAPPGIPADNSRAVFYAVNCADTEVVGGPGTFRRNLAEDAARYPFAGPAVGSTIGPCLFWPQVERLTRSTSTRPGLLIQSTGDPATPYEGAVQTQRDHPRMRIVSVDVNHHAVLGEFPNACVEDAASAWLNDGVLPAGNLDCGP